MKNEALVLLDRDKIQKAVKDDWALPKMEDLSRYDKIVVDTETSGLSIWDGHRTIGTALGLVKDDGSIDCRYHPYGHEGGEQ